jgi:N utilization substance protein B
MGKRRRAREMGVQMLYQVELGGVDADVVLASWPPSDLGDAENGTSANGDADARQYAETLIRGVLEHREKIDGLIREQASNWRLERMPIVDRTVLRIATFELLFQPDVPRVVIVDEAIEIAKRFGSDQSGSFVNGVLDGLLHAKHFPGEMH